jgi:hypothetical protein
LIEKFNFYDIYGYFLPGAIALLLFWLPIGLAQHKFPSGDWTSALLGAVLAYVTGILVQTFADKALRSTASKVKEGNEMRERFPSQQLLDPGGPLSETIKTGVADAAEDQFGIKKEKLAINQKANKEQDGVRNDAFFLARHFLVATKEAAYVEQYEGMYALTRGLAAAFGMAAVYYFGWAMSFLGGSWTSQAVYIAIAVGLIIALLSTIALVLRKKSILSLEWLASAALLLSALALGLWHGPPLQCSKTVCLASAVGVGSAPGKLARVPLL